VEGYGHTTVTTSFVLPRPTTVWKKHCRVCGVFTNAVPEARPIPALNRNLPFSPKLAVFGWISFPVFLTHMKNINKEDGNVAGGSQEKQEAKAPIAKLPRMEMYAVLGLELSKKIFEKLEEVEKSIEIIARQKARELDTKSPEAPGK
jgi:hypothetical protein